LFTLALGLLFDLSDELLGVVSLAEFLFRLPEAWRRYSEKAFRFRVTLSLQAHPEPVASLECGAELHSHWKAEGH
jgi:hypothetical protein